MILIRRNDLEIFFGNLYVQHHFVMIDNGPRKKILQFDEKWLNYFIIPILFFF